MDIKSNKKYIVLGGMIAMVGSAYLINEAGKDIVKENPDYNVLEEFQNTLKSVVVFIKSASDIIDSTLMNKIKKAEDEHIKSNS